MKKLDEIVDYSVLVPMKLVEEENFEIMYVDFLYTPNEERFETVDIDNPMTRNANPKNYGQVRPDVFTKFVELEREIDPVSVKKDFLNNIILLSEEQDQDLLEKFSFDPNPLVDHNANRRKLISKINMASSYIATNGRIGPANRIIMSEEIYNKYELDQLPNLEVILEDVDDIYLYRINNMDQPGLLLIHNDKKYSFVQIGFYPQKQFMKINLK